MTYGYTSAQKFMEDIGQASATVKGCKAEIEANME